MKLTPKIQKAIVKAKELHQGQTRKNDDLPYVVHPLSVASILSSYTKDEDIIASGLLHDILEDVPSHLYSAEDLKQDFGDRVYELVREVSEDRDPNDSKEKKKATWRERKEKYLANLQNNTPDSLLISCADKIHNLKSMMQAYQKDGENVWSEFHVGKNDQMWFFKEVLITLKKRLDHDIVDELEGVYFQAKHMFGV